jgi:hypothetical protein
MIIRTLVLFIDITPRSCAKQNKSVAEMLDHSPKVWDYGGLRCQQSSEYTYGRLEDRDNLSVVESAGHTGMNIRTIDSAVPTQIPTDLSSRES